MKTTKKKLLEERKELISDIRALLSTECNEKKIIVTLKWEAKDQIDIALLEGE